MNSLSRSPDTGASGVSTKTQEAKSPWSWRFWGIADATAIAARAMKVLESLKIMFVKYAMSFSLLEVRGMKFRLTLYQIFGGRRWPSSEKMFEFYKHISARVEVI